MFSASKPTERFDAEGWDRTYTAGRGSDLVFRRGAELAEALCVKLGEPGELWVDAGCGTGHLAAKLSRAGLSVVGVDHDVAMTDYAKRQFVDEQSPYSLDFVTGDAYDLPFGDETVDGVVATSLAGCLSKPEAFFREAFRVLRKGGAAVVTFTNRRSVLLKVNATLGRRRGKTRGSHEDPVFIRLYRYERVVEDLEGIGFEIVDVRFYNFFLNWAERVLPSEKWAGRFEGPNYPLFKRRLGRNFLVAGRKPMNASPSEQG